MHRHRVTEIHFYLTLRPSPPIIPAMANPSILAELPKHTRKAIAFYWQTRSRQVEKQRQAGATDQGLRGAVTGGAHMNGFIHLLTQLVTEAGIDPAHIHCQERLELPGYFRPSKRWDFMVIVNNQLVAALETKSQIESSFDDDSSQFEMEAIDKSMDVWRAFRAQRFAFPRPWLGYLLLFEPSPSASAPIAVKGAKEGPDNLADSPINRCESFCQRLWLERHYDGVAFLMAGPGKGPKGNYSLPIPAFAFETFANSLAAKIAVYTGRIKEL